MNVEVVSSCFQIAVLGDHREQDFGKICLRELWENLWFGLGELSHHLLWLRVLLKQYIWSLLLHLKLWVGVKQYLRLSLDYWVGVESLVVAQEGLSSDDRFLELISLSVVKNRLGVYELGWLVDWGSLLQLLGRSNWSLLCGKKSLDLLESLVKLSNRVRFLLHLGCFCLLEFLHNALALITRSNSGLRVVEEISELVQLFQGRMVSAERYVESDAKATAEDESDELTNSGNILFKLLSGELLAHLSLVDATK